METHDPPATEEGMAASKGEILLRDTKKEMKPEEEEKDRESKSEKQPTAQKEEPKAGAESSNEQQQGTEATAGGEDKPNVEATAEKGKKQTVSASDDGKRSEITKKSSEKEAAGKKEDDKKEQSTMKEGTPTEAMDTTMGLSTPKGKAKQAEENSKPTPKDIQPVKKDEENSAWKPETSEKVTAPARLPQDAGVTTKKASMVEYVEEANTTPDSNLSNSAPASTKRGRAKSEGAKPQIAKVCPTQVVPSVGTTRVQQEKEETNPEIRMESPNPVKKEETSLTILQKRVGVDEKPSGTKECDDKPTEVKAQTHPVLEEEDENRYDFPEDFPRRKRNKSMELKRARKKCKITIHSVGNHKKDAMEVDTPTRPSEATSSTSSLFLSNDALPCLSEFQSIAGYVHFSTMDRQQLERELEDSLFFFQDTHEEKTDAWIQFSKEREETALQQELAQIEKEDEEGRQGIDNSISQQSREKQIATTRSIEKYRAKAAQEEKRDTQKLLQAYHEKTTQNQGRIDQGIKILQTRHAQEMTKAMTTHRQQFQAQVNSPQAQQRWAAVTNQLQQKQLAQMNDFRKKGQLMKEKTEKDFKVQQERVRTSYQKKLHEIDSSRRKVYTRIFNSFQQLRQRCLKRHNQKITKKKEALLHAAKEQRAKRGDTAPIFMEKKPEDKSNYANKLDEKKEEFRPPSPLKSTLDWIQEERPHDSHVSGAAARHKQRKSVLQSIEKKLSVEIHNEGLWISIFADKSTKDGGDDANKAEDASSRSNATRGGDKGKGAAPKAGDDKKTGDKEKESTDTTQERFFPWGVEAHTILQSIICGEIPRGYHFADAETEFGEALTVQGGHVRCVVTDLRTNENTASAQRAASLKDQEEANLKGLEQKIVELSQLAKEAETTLGKAEEEEKGCKANVDKATGELEKAKKIQMEFRTKFASYLGSDGNPLPTTNSNDRQELAKAVMRYKANFDEASRSYNQARNSFNEARSRTQKMQAVAKHAQKAVAVATNLLKKKKAQLDPKSRARRSEAQENERATERVKNVREAFKKTAEKRREQLNKKRNSSASSTWVQSLPGLPGPLKKSLWHKMHRRRQQIVLRPSLESLTSELRDNVTRAIRTAQTGKKPQVDVEAELLRAEQLFCLAMHPAAPIESLPSVPPPTTGSSSEKWAEPGWQLMLDVPKEDRSSQILPCAPSFPVFGKNHAELCSAPGRQAASFTRTGHLRCLASNLSAVSTATSLAETNPSAPSRVTLADGDPLNVWTETWTTGYAFHINPPAKSTQKRKSSSALALKESAAAAGADLAKGKQASESAASAPAAAKAPEQSTATAEKGGKAAPKKRRTSRTSTSNPSPRARKTKADTKRLSATQHQPPALARAPSSYRQPTAPAAAAAAAAAQYNQYMKHSSPPQAQQQQQQQLAYQQQMQQQRQQQQARQPQGQPGQYGSPQQRQMALMMQQRTQQQSVQSRVVPTGYPQRPPQQFFNPMTGATGGPPAYQPPQHMQIQGMQQMPQMGQPGLHPSQLQQQQQQKQQQQQRGRSPKGAVR